MGGAFFERMLLPIGLALLTLMADAPLLPWRRRRRAAPASPALAGGDGRGLALVLAALLGARGVPAGCWPSARRRLRRRSALRQPS